MGSSNPEALKFPKAYVYLVVLNLIHPKPQNSEPKPETPKTLNPNLCINPKAFNI